jgi:hypothetical protein
MRSQIAQELPYRLRSRSSARKEILVRILVTLLWNAIFGGFTYMSWTHDPSQTPVFIWAILALFALIGLGMVWDVVVRIARAWLGRVPIIEVDLQPVRLGETLTVRVCESHPASLSRLEVELVGVTMTTSGSTTTTRYGIRTSLMACVPPELAVRPRFDRTTSFMLPAANQVPAGTVRWELLVGSVLRQGGLLLSAFPIEVTP